MPIKPKAFIWGACDFAILAKTCETCNDSCNVEKYTSVIWTCQHSTSALKKTFEILAQKFVFAY